MDYFTTYVITINFTGQEFQAVFLSTTEPVSEDGNTLNPTKSPCDRYIFNTVLTRAKSLVVVVGSPRILLNTESHMVKLYGDKGRCWSLYLKSCLEHGTLIVPSLVESDQSIAQRFKEQLAAHLGATLPRFQSSRPNYRTRGTNFSVASNTHTISGPRLVAQSTQHPSALLKSGIRLVHKPLSSDENVFKQMSQVEYVAPVNIQTTSLSYSQSAVQKQPATFPMGSVLKFNAATKSEGVKNRGNIRDSRMDSADSINAALSSSQTVNATPSKSIKLAASPLLSESMIGHDVEAYNLRSRGNTYTLFCNYILPLFEYVTIATMYTLYQQT